MQWCPHVTRNSEFTDLITICGTMGNIRNWDFPGKRIFNPDGTYTEAGSNFWSQELQNYMDTNAR